MATPNADRIKIPRALWLGLARAGIAAADVVREARIPVAVLRDDAAVSTEQFFAVWRAIESVSDDPAIGLRIATGLDVQSMPLSFMAAYHARDFHDALQRAARFKRLCAPEEVRIEEHEDHATVTFHWLHAGGDTTPAALVDATLVSMVELGRSGTGTPIAPLKVELARPARARERFEQYFNCKVRYKADVDRLVFHRDDLSQPFLNYNQELLAMLLPELDRRLEQQTHAVSVAAQAKWGLRRRLTAGRPDIRSVATELAMSERSLQRKLTDEGVTFLALLSDTRHELALEYLSDPALEIMEVAYMLGYEDQNSLFRAFRQWEHQTPSEWRAEHLVVRSP